MTIQLTGRIGTVISDYDDYWQAYRGYYDVTIWYQGTRYSTRVEFDNIEYEDDLPCQGDGVAIKFDTETKTIEIL